LPDSHGELEVRGQRVTAPLAAGFVRKAAPCTGGRTGRLPELQEAGVNRPP